MVGAHLERLVTTHDKADFLCLFVLQETHIARATFLPFLRLLIETEEFRTTIHELARKNHHGDKKKKKKQHVHLELHIFILLVCLYFDFVLQFDHRVELGVMFSFSSL